MSEIHHKPPPSIALRLFRWYCRKDRLEELEGDLEEMHEYRQLRGYSSLRLKLSFWWDVIRCIKTYSIKKSARYMNTSLYQSYFKVALRNSRKNLGPVLINVIGMGLSLGFCFTVYMMHAYNFEFDLQHSESVDMHRLHSIRWYNEEPRRYEQAPLPFVAKIESEISGVDGVTHYDIEQVTVKSPNAASSEYFTQAIASVRSNFFDFFHLPLKQGNLGNLKNESTVFLSVETAEKLFGDISPLGETVTVFIGKDKGIDLQVAGVFEKIALNNSFNFHLLVNHETMLKAHHATRSSWDKDHNVAIYIKTKTPETVLSAISAFIPEQHIQQENWKISKMDLPPFLNHGLSEDTVTYAPANFPIGFSALLVFTILGLLILAIACFNLANTAMALMSKRVREIGIRKTLGTSNIQLFEQFMMEMLVVSTIAFCVAIALANPISNQIFGLFGVSFVLQDISIIRFVPFVLVFLFCCTFLAGVLPALYAWKFSPSVILSGKQSLKGVSWFQRFLTIGQYTVSICLLICAWTFGVNNKYLGEIDLGYNYNQIVMLPLDAPTDYDQVKNDLDQMSSVEKVIGTKSHHGRTLSKTPLATDTVDIEVATYWVSPEYLSTMEIDLVNGRKFLEGSLLDVESSVIVNEEFAFRYLDSVDPLQGQVEINGEKRNVVGIASDIIHDVYANFRPRPVAYIPIQKDQFSTLIIKTSLSNTDDFEDKLRVYWSENFETRYRGKGQKLVSSFYATRDSRNLKLIFLSIAILGSLLSTIGIFSMAVMHVAKRNKEICVRRVLGARIDQVMIKIFKSFQWTIGLSLLFGTVGGILLSETVLQSIYKFYLSAEILDSTLIGVVIMTIALLFIAIAAFRRVIANPSIGLRTE